MDVSRHALMRGLVTACPISVRGCSCLTTGISTRLASSDCSGASHRGPASSHAQQLVVLFLSYCGIELYVIHPAAVPRGCGSTWCAIAERKAAISRAI